MTAAARRRGAVVQDAMAAQVEEPMPFTEQQKQAARRIVCGNAVDIADAVDLLSMLGILPGQDDLGINSVSPGASAAPARLVGA